MAQLYRRHFTLERVLILAGVFLLIGLAIDLYVFLVWVTDGDLGSSGAGITALAQSSLIIGANVALGGFLTALIDTE